MATGYYAARKTAITSPTMRRVKTKGYGVT